MQISPHQTFDAPCGTLVENIAWCQPLKAIVAFMSLKNGKDLHSLVAVGTVNAMHQCFIDLLINRTVTCMVNAHICRSIDA